MSTVKARQAGKHSGLLCLVWCTCTLQQEAELTFSGIKFNMGSRGSWGETCHQIYFICSLLKCSKLIIVSKYNSKPWIFKGVIFNCRLLSPSHEMFFCLDPSTPPEIPVKLHTFLLKFWILRHPSPLEFPITLLGEDINIFWNCAIQGKYVAIHLAVSCQRNWN